MDGPTIKTRLLRTLRDARIEIERVERLVESMDTDVLEVAYQRGFVAQALNGMEHGIERAIGLGRVRLFDLDNTEHT